VVEECRERNHDIGETSGGMDGSVLGGLNLWWCGAFGEVRAVDLMDGLVARVAKTTTQESWFS